VEVPKGEVVMLRLSMGTLRWSVEERGVAAGAMHAVLLTRKMFVPNVREKS